MQTIVIELVKKFILRQALKYGAGLDWALIKKDALARVADLLPGTDFDREAQIICGVIIDLCAEFFVKTGQVIDASSLAAVVHDAINGKVAVELAKRVG